MPTELTRPYWEACRAGRLSVQRCGECRRFVHFPRPLCPWCGSRSLAFEPVSGAGTVHTFSVIHRAFLPGFAELTPYVVAWVDLPEQRDLRVFANIIGCPPEQVKIGLEVVVTFEDVQDFGPIPQFTPKEIAGA